jgi:hypothetical protein
VPASCLGELADDSGSEALASAAQMSKAQKALEKKNKAQSFSSKKAAGAVTKNSKRWG